MTGWCSAFSFQRTKRSFSGRKLGHRAAFFLSLSLLAERNVLRRNAISSYPIALSAPCRGWRPLNTIFLVDRRCRLRLLPPASLSLSLSLYIYIYMCIHIHIRKYISFPYTTLTRTDRPLRPRSSPGTSRRSKGAFSTNKHCALWSSATSTDFYAAHVYPFEVAGA